jgi:sugar transferase EpsL
MLLTGLLIRIMLGKPVFFIQQRPGLYGKPFKIIKFRTMSEKYDSSGNLLPDHERLTTLGRWLRKTSLDELPELFNVLKGDMSLVGPRPLLMEYLNRYTPEQARRHEVKPGITGWAQINGRNAISWEEKFKLDVWYVEHANIWLDLKILLLTLITVIKGQGVSADDHVTMPPFTGSNKERSS